MDEMDIQNMVFVFVDEGLRRDRKFDQHSE